MFHALVCFTSLFLVVLGTEEGLTCKSAVKKNFTGTWRLPGGRYKTNQTCVFEVPGFVVLIVFQFYSSKNRFFSLEGSIYDADFIHYRNAIDFSIVDFYNNSFSLTDYNLHACTGSFSTTLPCSMVFPASYLKFTLKLTDDPALNLTLLNINNFTIIAKEHWIFTKSNTRNVTIEPMSEPRIFAINQLESNITYTYQSPVPLFFTFVSASSWAEGSAEHEGVFLYNGTSSMGTLFNIFGNNQIRSKSLSIYSTSTIYDAINLVIMDASLTESFYPLHISSPSREYAFNYVVLNETNNMTTYFCNETKGAEYFNLYQVELATDTFELEVYKGWPWHITEENFLISYNQMNINQSLPQIFDCTAKTFLLKQGECTLGTRITSEEEIEPVWNRIGFLSVDDEERTYKFTETISLRYYTFTPRVGMNHTNQFLMKVNSKFNNSVYESYEAITLQSVMSLTINGTVIVDFEITEHDPRLSTTEVFQEQTKAPIDAETGSTGNPQDNANGRESSLTAALLTFLLPNIFSHFCK